MELLLKNRDPAVVLCLIGEVDMTSSNKIRDNIEQLIAEDKTKVVINLEAATGADSSGLGTLVAGLTNLRKAGGELALCCMGADMRNVMDITNVLNFFPVYETEDEACAAFNPSEQAV